MRLRAISVLLIGAFLTWAAPLAGLALAGLPVAGFIAFPPRTAQVIHAPFSWGVFVVVSVPALAAAALYALAVLRASAKPAASPVRGRFPWWGWLGVALAATGWCLAWSEGAVPPAWRRHTFTPLWLGYVLVMNALACRRSGASPLTHRTRWLLALFPVSAVFWWLFEHLNQFVNNWYYTGTAATGDWDYFLQASLPFSTVLPAVASTWSWLKTFPRLDALEFVSVRGNPVLPWLATLGGALALAGIGVYPGILYAALWLGPLLLILGLQQLLLGETLLAPLAHGDWRPLLQPALAGLICGLFWELWNYGSAAQWHYSIPYVQQFYVFEMPLLGYAGYLPFGVECAVVMNLMDEAVGRTQAERHRSWRRDSFRPSR